MLPPDLPATLRLRTDVDFEVLSRPLSRILAFSLSRLLAPFLSRFNNLSPAIAKRDKQRGCGFCGASTGWRYLLIKISRNLRFPCLCDTGARN